MSLHIDVVGKGPDLVLLHGWSLHNGIWQDLLPLLQDDFCCHLVDLPGHGLSEFANQETLPEWAAEVRAVVPQQADWIGWSLGGLVALQALAEDAQSMRRLVLLASSPCFVKRPDWPSAVEFSVFENFANELQQDFDKVLLRFLALQVMGSQAARASLKQLRDALLLKPAPQVAALLAGLHFLREADFRQLAVARQDSIYWLSGSRDTLVPQAAANLLPEERVQIIEAAGHAPFVSHAEICAKALRQWLL